MAEVELLFVLALVLATGFVVGFRAGRRTLEGENTELAAELCAERKKSAALAEQAQLVRLGDYIWAASRVRWVNRLVGGDEANRGPDERLDVELN